MNQDSLNLRKGKTRISWGWRMLNDHYRVRKKARKHGKWGMKQDLAAWKLELKNLMTLYTLTFRTNLEHFLESIIYILYIVSKLGKSKVQRFKWFANRSWNEVWPFEDNCTKLEGHFEMISKFNLWIRNPLRNDTNFEFIHCHFDVPFPLPWELHLKHSICPRWTPHD